MKGTLPFFFSIILTASAAGDGGWEATSLWSPENPKFTEKGSREFQTGESPMLRSIRVSRRNVPAGSSCEAMFAKIRSASSASELHVMVPQANEMIRRLNTMGTNVVDSPYAPIDLKAELDRLESRGMTISHSAETRGGPA